MNDFFNVYFALKLMIIRISVHFIGFLPQPQCSQKILLKQERKNFQLTSNPQPKAPVEQQRNKLYGFCWVIITLRKCHVCLCSGFQSVWIYLINLFSRDCSRQHEEVVVFQLNRRVLLILTWSFLNTIPLCSLVLNFQKVTFVEESRTIYIFVFALYMQLWCV